ncbi:MAG TPA: hypothetical protein PK395_18325 [bacterium]|nr:hypothetical protein [bacterium]HQQ00449.1 hypothetical protein [bacterium]
MNLSEYEQIIVDSAREDWTKIVCESGTGPSYLNSTQIPTDGYPVESHSMRASLKRDLSIGFAWGLTLNPNFEPPWAKKFIHPTASVVLIDFFYNENLVFRDCYVSVDEGRCLLPQPEEVQDSEGKITNTVPRNRYEFFKTLNELERQGSYFESYFQNAGFQIVELPWMT